LSVLVLTLWQVFYMNPRIETQREAARVEQSRQEAQAPQPAQPGTGEAAGEVPGQTAPAAPGVPAAETLQGALASGARVKIDTPRLSGSINLTGARLDDLVLKDYRETVEDNSPQIHLLKP